MGKQNITLHPVGAADVDLYPKTDSTQIADLGTNSCNIALKSDLFRYARKFSLTPTSKLSEVYDIIGTTPFVLDNVGLAVFISANEIYIQKATGYYHKNDLTSGTTISEVLTEQNFVSYPLNIIANEPLTGGESALTSLKIAETNYKVGNVFGANNSSKNEVMLFSDNTGKNVKRSSISISSSNGGNNYIGAPGGEKLIINDNGKMSEMSGKNSSNNKQTVRVENGLQISAKDTGPGLETHYGVLKTNNVGSSDVVLEFPNEGGTITVGFTTTDFILDN